jgi:hypothetical protein
MKNKEFYIQIATLQPSQLFISDEKLQRNQEWLDSPDINYDAIPIINLDGKIIMTDGHTRAYILSNLGVKKIKVLWDLDKLDLEAYQECVRWCESEKISSIQDLANRVISADDYQIQWIGKCQKMHKDLAELRERNDEKHD